MSNITQIAQSGSTTVTLPRWSMITITTSGSCLIQRSKGPNSVVEKSSVSEGSKKFGPYARQFSFKVTALQNGATINVSDTIDDLVLIDKKAQDTSVKTPNQLIKVNPTRVVYPYESRLETSLFSSSDASVALGNLKYDPLSSSPYAKVTIPSNDTGWQGVKYDNITPFNMSHEDVWMVSAYIPVLIPLGDVVEVELRVSNESTVGATNYRSFKFSNPTVQRGYNLFTCMNVETKLFTNEHVQNKTNVRASWVEHGNSSSDKAVNSIQIVCRNSSANPAATEVHLGAVLRAPAGWATSVVSFQVDDFIRSFYDLGADKIIASYGWNHSNACVSGYSAEGEDFPGGTARMSLEEALDFINETDNELWSHLLRHDRMDGSISTEVKIKALEASKAYWQTKGSNTPAKFIVWPFGKYDEETIALTKARGYKLASTTSGDETNPMLVGVNPYNLNRFVLEGSNNSYFGDNHFRGCILRGTSVITGLHAAVVGGADTPNRPAPNQFYLDHLKRWCDVLAYWEGEDRVIVAPPLRYFKLCGIDPENHNFLEW